MTTWKIEHNDVIEWAKSYSGSKFHSIFCDPPYHLVSINKRFSKPGSKPPKGGVYKRASAGFMQSEWDGGDLAFNPETWAALAEHLYPGAFIMAFASSRGWHRMAVAMEDSGLVLHPSIFMMGWNYLSGFPKATRIKGDGSQAFSGHRYGLQALKPALEPIIVAQVPYSGRPVDSIVETGAGALWIDGGRISLANGESTESVNKGATKYGGIFGNGQPITQTDLQGRWPANFVLSHSPLDNGECVADCPVRLFDEQAGESVSKRSMRGEQSDIRGDNYNRSNGAKLPDSDSERGYDDSGPASRMFHRSSYEYEAIEASDPLMKLREGLTERQRLFVTEELKKVGLL